MPANRTQARQTRSRQPLPAKQDAPASRRLHRADGLALLLLFGMTLLTFYPALSCDFVNYDDPDYVYENPQVLQGLTAQGFTWAWSSTHAANWHPLTWLSLMLDTTLYGGQP